MKLHTRFKKTVAMAVVATTVMTAMPAATFAADYTGHWAQNVIEAWKDKGIIDGYEDGTFKPKNQVTRAELAKMLSEVFGLTNKEGAIKFKDIQTDNWHSNYVDLVSAAGLMTGTTNGEFRPNEPATREEAAYALAKAYHVVGTTDKTYTDQVQISAWAVESVEALVANGYINGYPDGTFKPQGSLTRAEIVVMLDRMTAEIVNKGGVHTKDTEGNIVINAKGVTLKDMTINGNLYLAEGIGEGDITLDGVTVTGDVIVEGGGINSIHIKGKSKIKNIKVSKAGEKPVRLAIQGSATITGIIEVESPTVIHGTGAVINKVVLSGGTLELKGSIEIKELVVTAPTTVTLTGGEVVVDKLEVAKLAEKTTLKGNGTIKEVDVKANGLKYAGTLTIDKMVVDPAVTTLPSQIVTGGGGGPSGPVTTPSIKLGDAKIYLKDQEKPVIVNLNTSTMTIDATSTSGIKIGGVEFTPDMSIVAAEAYANLATVDVSLIPGATSDDVTLKSNHKYDLAQLVVEVKAKEAFVKEMVAKFAVAQGELPTQEKPLTYEQGQKVLGWMTKAIKIVEAGAKDGEVSVSAIQSYIQDAKEKINAHGGVARINKDFEKILQFIGITLSENAEGEITATFKLQATASGYETKTIDVTVKF